MRLIFPNSTRPKRAAKHLSAALRIPLSTVQETIAHACGFRDWHEIEKSYGAGTPFVLDEALPSGDFVRRLADLCLTISKEVGAPHGDVQYALIGSRLTGNRPIWLDEQLTIRTECWRKAELPPVAPRKSGAVGKLRSPGRNGEPVVLRRYGKPTSAIGHQEILTVADFEYQSPQKPLGLFIPMRLYLPYGVWTEPDGSQVIFNRDYKPLWRVRMDGTVDRIEPWLWIDFVDQRFLWEDARTPWRDRILQAELRQLLSEFRIVGLPILADALPLLVHTDQHDDPLMASGAELLKIDRNFRQTK